MQDPQPNRVVVFTGLPGTGKSTLAEQVARAMLLASHQPFGDDQIHLLAKRTLVSGLFRGDYVN